MVGLPFSEQSSVEPPEENMISDKLYEECTSSKSVARTLQENPDLEPGDAAETIYKIHNLKVFDSPRPKKIRPATAEDVKRAKLCGRFEGTEPSELFLRAFHDVLGTLERDSLASCVSPSMIGTTGYNPMAIIGPLWDIVRHMSNLIVRAEKEVLLATNYWMASGASRLITDALVELSKRAGERGVTIPVRIMYDRGDVKQVIKNHQLVEEATFSGGTIKLPKYEEVPNLDMKVVNFHRPMLGTFHAKFLVVDRSIAITQSNNIQDNDNVEMAAQWEGAVVDSLWEAFLISWHADIAHLACLGDKAADEKPPTYQQKTFDELLTLDGKFGLSEQAKVDRSLKEHVGGAPHWDVDLAGEMHRLHATLTPQGEEVEPQFIADHLNQSTQQALKATAPAAETGLRFFPFIPIPRHGPVPVAIVSRKPFGSPNHTSLYVPQNESFLSLLRNAKHSVFIQTPDLNASPLFEAITEAVRRGITVTYYVCLGYNDAGELLPGQNGTNEMFAHSLYQELEQNPGADGVQAAKDRLRVHYYVAKDQIQPLSNKFKQRSCHIKLMIADEQVAVQGSGNQDTQSWWHSQEVNVMVDSAVICKAWREGIERNQNTGVVPPEETKAYGRAAEDGCWYDKEGKLAEGSLGTDPGRFAWAQGMVGAVKRATGKGGF